jgi:hypothetical protein
MAVQQTGASRHADCPCGRSGWLAPVADLCVESMKWRSLDSHASLLAEAISGIGEQNLELFDTVRYLQMASGLRGIDFDTARFDPYPGYCEAADEHTDQQDRLFAVLTRRIAVFLFVWASLESLREKVALPNLPRGVKRPRQIDRLCYFLTMHYSLPLPSGYTEALSCLRKIAAKSEIGRGAAVSPGLPAYIGPSGEALYRVYELRNKLAHGDFSTPFPEGPPEKHPDVFMVCICTRLVLLSIQMIVLCKYPSTHPVDLPSFLVFTDSEQCKTVADVFPVLHLETFMKETEPDSAPNGGPPSQLPTSPEIQTSDSQRTPPCGGCG